MLRNVLACRACGVRQFCRFYKLIGQRDRKKAYCEQALGPDSKGGTFTYEQVFSSPYESGALESFSRLVGCLRRKPSRHEVADKTVQQNQAIRQRIPSLRFQRVTGYLCDDKGPTPLMENHRTGSPLAKGRIGDATHLLPRLFPFFPSICPNNCFSLAMPPRRGCGHD